MLRDFLILNYTNLNKLIKWNFKNNMKIVILAGGLGTRISEYTKTIPKPMIKINNKPLILLIMQHYAKYMWL